MRNIRLWVRLALITLLLVIPLGALLVTLMVTERSTALDASRAGLQKLAQLAAAQENDELEDASNLVRVLALVPDVANAVPGACHAILKELVNEHPLVGGIAVGDPGGTVLCESGNPVPRPMSLAGRDWYRRLKADDATSVVMSDLVVGQLTGKLTVVVATQVRQAGGVGSLSAGLSLEWLSAVGDRLGEANDAIVTVVSVPTRTVLSSSGSQLAPIGTVLPAGPLFDAMQRTGTGFFDDDAAGGTGLIYGFAPLPWTGGDQVAVLISRHRDSVVGVANRRLVVSLLLLLMVAAAGCGAFLAVTLFLVVRPVRVLIGIAEALGRGGLHARVPLQAMQGPEFRALASALNDTAVQLADRERTLAGLAMRDGLTGIANRRRFDEALADIWTERQPQAGIVMIDIDHFKAFNDLYGHQEGDGALRLVARTIADTVRPESDTVARYGGEEFVVLMPGIEVTMVEAVGERLVAAVRALEIPHRGSPSGFLTISAGLAWSTRSASVEDGEVLLRLADAALYQAKRGGRDQAFLDDSVVLER